MKFTEILEELRKGEEVTREKWEKCKTECYKYIKLEHGEIIAYLKDDTGEDKVEERTKCMFELVDFTAEDWKIWIEKPKDIKIRNWQPEQGETYYLISTHGSVDYTTYDSNSRIDSESLSFGNCFKTRKEAQYMLEKIKIINQLRKMSNSSFEGNTETKKWFVVYNCGCQRIGYNYMYIDKIAPFNIYFASKEDCQKAVETIGEDNLKKYYFDVED